MKLNVWAPGGPSGVSDYADEQAEALAAHLSVARISDTEAPGPPSADLDLYHIGNSPAHGYVYRAALARPGVVLLHDWSLNDLVRSETLERGEPQAWLREMRRAHGEEGAFVARQFALGLGNESWTTLYPVNDRVLEASLGMVVPTPVSAARVSRRLRNLPVLALPRHLSPSLHPLPTRAEARKALDLPESAFVVSALGPAASDVQLDLATQVIARLRVKHPQVVLLPAGPENLTHSLVTADAVLALHLPRHGGIPDSVVRALGVGRPVLVTAGTPADDAFPEGLVLPVDPGHAGAASLEALLSRLIEDTDLRESVGRRARAHVLAHHDLATTARALAGFLGDLRRDRESLERAVAARRPAQGSLQERLIDEARAAAHDLGLDGLSLGIEPLLGPPA